MDQKENEWTNGSQYETEQQLPNQTESQNSAKTSFHKREASKPIVKDLATTQLAPAMEGQDLVRQFELIAKYLEKKGADWADRVGSLEKLHQLADADAAQHEEFLAFLIRLRDPLIIQIKDLRSQIVKEACGTIGSIALAFQRLGQANGSLKLPKGWPSLAVAFMETSLKQTPVTIKVISEAALDCVRTIIKSAAPFGIQKMAEKLCAGASDKSSHIRLVCIQCIALAMDEWTMFARSGTSAKVWIEIRNTLKSGLFDSDENVRKAVRECFWSFHECAKEPAEQLLNMQDDAVKRRILESRPVHRKQQPNAAEHVQPKTVLGARIDQVTLASTSSSAARSPSTVSSPEQMISPIRRTWSEDGSDAGSPGTGDTGHRASLDDEQSTIDTIIDSSHDASALAENISENSTPMQAPAARPVAVPQQVNPAPRHRGAMRIQRNEEPPVKSAREYNASDYAENGAGLKKSTAGARRVAAPQRVINRNTRAASAAPVQAHQPPSRSSSVGGPQRVDGHSASRSNSMTVSSMDMASVGDTTLSSSQLEHKISAIEASTLWSARVDAVQDIIAAQKAGTSFSASIVSKLVPALCGRADDQHHKVAQEVLQAVCIFLPLYSKEFGEHLRTLLPALLSGLSDSHSTTRRLSNKALNCCIATYPADHLCALLSSICRRNGDKLRQGCVDCLKGLVPRSSSYFSTELHVSQLLSRLEKCLSSRKTDLRTASGDLVEAVFRFDQGTFAAVLNSGELPPSLHALVTKVMSSKVKNFASILAAANAGSQDPSPARAQNANGSLPASTAVPGSNQKGETAVQQTPTESGPRHERRRSTTGIATPVSTTEGTTVYSDDRRKSALEVFSTSSRSSGTLKSQTPTPESESTPSQTTSSIHATTSSASSVSSQSHSRPSSPTRSTSTTLSPIKGASGDERVRNIISGLVTENTDELNRALRKASELLKAEETGKQAVDWNRWLGQMLVACLGHITHPDPLSRELALRVITVMATTQPKITSESTEFLFERLLNLFDQPQSVSVADKTLNVLIENLDANRCFSTLLAILSRGQEGGLSRRALQYLRPLLVRVSVVTLKPALPTLMPLLSKAFQSSDANSRRSAMHCYVELHAALGDSFSSHLEVLSKVQQKLVAMYIERRKSID